MTQFSLLLEKWKQKIKEWCKVSGQKVPQTKGQIVRVVLESLALTYLETITQLEQLTKHEMTTVQMVGGGIQNKLLLPVNSRLYRTYSYHGAGRSECTGNILSQMLTLGVISSRKRSTRHYQGFRTCNAL